MDVRIALAVMSLAVVEPCISFGLTIRLLPRCMRSNTAHSANMDTFDLAVFG